MFAAAVSAQAQPAALPTAPNAFLTMSASLDDARRHQRIDAVEGRVASGGVESAVLVQPVERLAQRLDARLAGGQRTGGR